MYNAKGPRSAAYTESWGWTDGVQNLGYTHGVHEKILKAH